METINKEMSEELVTKFLNMLKVKVAANIAGEETDTPADYDAMSRAIIKLGNRFLKELIELALAQTDTTSKTYGFVHVCYVMQGITHGTVDLVDWCFSELQITEGVPQTGTELTQ